MAQFTGNKQQAFIKAMNERGGFKPCPKCGNSKYSVLNGVAHIWMSDECDARIAVNESTKSYYNCATVTCTNCGHVDFYSLDALGLQ